VAKGEPWARGATTCQRLIGRGDCSSRLCAKLAARALASAGGAGLQGPPVPRVLQKDILVPCRVVPVLSSKRGEVTIRMHIAAESAGHGVLPCRARKKATGAGGSDSHRGQRVIAPEHSPNFTWVPRSKRCATHLTHRNSHHDPDCPKAIWWSPSHRIRRPRFRRFLDRVFPRLLDAWPRVFSRTHTGTTM
jgi:hypothetical protein